MLSVSFSRAGRCLMLLLLLLLQNVALMKQERIDVCRCY